MSRIAATLSVAAAGGVAAYAGFVVGALLFEGPAKATVSAPADPAPAVSAALPTDAPGTPGEPAGKDLAVQAAEASVRVAAAAAAAAAAPASAPTALPRAGEDAARLAALEAEIPTLDYQAARYHRLYFAPDIYQASDAECLACHSEILTERPRETSPAGISGADSLSWYQTLDTYDGSQQSFHWRHLQSDYAQAVMNLGCNFCHEGNDPREEVPATAAGDAAPPFTLRKMVSPSTTCLLCHGAMPSPEEIMGLPGAWPEIRADMESADEPNGCLSCHRELFRTNRHNVTYLNAAAIEDLAAASSDVCFGCHGGRQWYRIAYPYPRTPWPGMDPEVPDWAKDRPTQSAARFHIVPGSQ